MNRTLRPGVLTAAVALLALGLAGCGDDEPEAEDGGPAATTDASAVFAIEDEVTTVAPALESAYRSGPYPQTVDEAVASLGPAGVSLRDGTTIGAYVYDADAVEFLLCLQEESGAWASYDTAPMGVRDSGTEGGCPQE